MIFARGVHDGRAPALCSRLGTANDDQHARYERRRRGGRTTHKRLCVRGKITYGTLFGWHSGRYATVRRLTHFDTASAPQYHHLPAKTSPPPRGGRLLEDSKNAFCPSRTMAVRVRRPRRDVNHYTPFSDMNLGGTKTTRKRAGKKIRIGQDPTGW